MPHLRPPIAVHVPEEWDWAAKRPLSSAYNPIHRLADIIRDGLRADGLTNIYTVTPQTDDIFITRHRVPFPASSHDRIMISPGNPYRASEAWHAIDRETYDGAPDNPARNHYGAGATEADAARELLYIMCEEPRLYDTATLAAIAAEIARRWP